MSTFIAWHVSAILIIGPSHPSYSRSKVIGIYQNYLDLLYLDGGWAFYAPNPPFGSYMEYETILSTGKKQTYPLTMAYEKFDHAYVRNVNFYLYFFTNPEQTIELGYDKSVARYLCDKHSDESVKQLTFFRYLQKRFTYQDYQHGKHPLGQEFLDKFTYGPYPCNGAADE